MSADRIITKSEKDKLEISFCLQYCFPGKSESKSGSKIVQERVVVEGRVLDVCGRANHSDRELSCINVVDVAKGQSWLMKFPQKPHLASIFCDVPYLLNPKRLDDCVRNLAHRVKIKCVSGKELVTFRVGGPDEASTLCRCFVKVGGKKLSVYGWCDNMGRLWFYAEDTESGDIFRFRVPNGSDLSPFLARNEAALPVAALLKRLAQRLEVVNQGGELVLRLRQPPSKTGKRSARRPSLTQRSENEYSSDSDSEEETAAKPVSVPAVAMLSPSILLSNISGSQLSRNSRSLASLDGLSTIDTMASISSVLDTGDISTLPAPLLNMNDPVSGRPEYAVTVGGKWNISRARQKAALKMREKLIQRQMQSMESEVREEEHRKRAEMLLDVAAKNRNRRRKDLCSWKTQRRAMTKKFLTRQQSNRDIEKKKEFARLQQRLRCREEEMKRRKEEEEERRELQRRKKEKLAKKRLRKKLMLQLVKEKMEKKRREKEVLLQKKRRQEIESWKRNQEAMNRKAGLNVTGGFGGAPRSFQTKEELLNSEKVGLIAGDGHQLQARRRKRREQRLPHIQESPDSTKMPSGRKTSQGFDAKTRASQRASRDFQLSPPRLNGVEEEENETADDSALDRSPKSRPAPLVPQQSWKEGTERSALHLPPHSPLTDDRVLFPAILGAPPKAAEGDEKRSPKRKRITPAEVYYNTAEEEDRKWVDSMALASFSVEPKPALSPKKTRRGASDSPLGRHSPQLVSRASAVSPPRRKSPPGSPSILRRIPGPSQAPLPARYQPNSGASLDAAKELSATASRKLLSALSADTDSLLDDVHSALEASQAARQAGMLARSTAEQNGGEEKCIESP